MKMVTFEVQIEDIIEVRSLVELQILADLLKTLLSHPAGGKLSFTLYIKCCFPAYSLALQWYSLKGLLFSVYHCKASWE